jgi:hypothetical protein
VRIAFGLQLGGAFGNLFDRVRIGHVTDFIDIGPWPIFNIADSAIVTGITLMFLYLTRGNKPEESPDGTAAATGGAGGVQARGETPAASALSAEPDKERE